MTGQSKKQRAKRIVAKRRPQRELVARMMIRVCPRCGIGSPAHEWGLLGCPECVAFDSRQLQLRYDGGDR